MAKSIDMEQDQLLRLLTDALRAGPASPEWHQAVSMLRATDGSADEYRLLMTARENLERGKDYRAVRPGPGFTRKVMDGVEAESTRSGPNTANWIAIGGALALLGVIGLVAYFLASSAAPEKDSLNELSKAYIVSTRLNASFENGMPQGARVVGPLPLVTRQGLRPGPAGDAPQGAVLIPNEPIPATNTAALEVDLQVQRPVDETFFQIFLTDDAAFSEDRATSDHELTWVLSGKTASVMLPDKYPCGPSSALP